MTECTAFSNKLFCRGRRAFSDICKGLYALHSNGICHLDLKTPNVLLFDDGLCKISDLGQGRIIQSGRNTITAENMGTWIWMAPEQFLGKCGLSSDIWSLSTILVEVSDHTIRSVLELGQSILFWAALSIYEWQWAVMFIDLNQHMKSTSWSLYLNAKARLYHGTFSSSLVWPSISPDYSRSFSILFWLTERGCVWSSREAFATRRSQSCACPKPLRVRGICRFAHWSHPLERLLLLTSMYPWTRPES